MNISFSDRLYTSLLIKSIEEGNIPAANRIAEMFVGKPNEGEHDLELISQILRWINLESNASPYERAHALLSGLPFHGKHHKRIYARVFVELESMLAEQNYWQGHYFRTIYHLLRGVIWSKGSSINRHNLLLTVKAAVRTVIGHQPISLPSVPPHTDLDGVLKTIEDTLCSPIQEIQAIKTICSPGKLYAIQINHKAYILRIAREGYLRDSVGLIQRLFTQGIPVPVVITSNVDQDPEHRVTWYLEEKVTGSWNEGLVDLHTSFNDLGTQLKRLHSIPSFGFGPILSDKLNTPFPTFDLWLENLQSMLLERQHIGRIPEEAFGKLEQAFVFLRSAYRQGPVLCHGDIRGNVIFKDGKLQALIDWEEVHGNDPAYDFGFLLVDLEFNNNNAGRRSDILNYLLETYSPKEPEEFIRRIYAHRYLKAAASLCWSEAPSEYVKFSQSILRDSEIFDGSIK